MLALANKEVRVLLLFLFYALGTNAYAGLWTLNHSKIGPSAIALSTERCNAYAESRANNGEYIITTHYVHSGYYHPEYIGSPLLIFEFACHAEGKHAVTDAPNVWHQVLGYERVYELATPNNSPGPDLGPGHCNGGTSPLRGNPIHGQTGNKYQQERDYSSNGIGGVSFTRYYNSFGNHNIASRMGNNWRHFYERFLLKAGNTYTLYRHDGRRYKWIENSGSYTSAEDKASTLTYNAVNDHWEYKTSDDAIEIYAGGNDSKLLRSITNRQGITQTLTWNDDKLGSVTDSFGRSINFHYSELGYVNTITDPDTGVYTYEHDADGNLISVTYPDTTQKHYGYHPTLASALTSITDERGNLFVTWTYDDVTGKATSSQRAGGSETTTLEYDFDGTGATRETNALGKQTVYQYQQIAGVQRVVQVDGLASDNCAAANQSYTYDANGFLLGKVDWNGNDTRYTRDTRGNELTRTEAFGTPLTKTISTEWEANFNLPKKITEPNRVIEFSYDGAGNLLMRTEKPLTVP